MDLEPIIINSERQFYEWTLENEDELYPVENMTCFRVAFWKIWTLEK